MDSRPLPLEDIVTDTPFPLLTVFASWEFKTTINNSAYITELTGVVSVTMNILLTCTQNDLHLHKLNGHVHFLYDLEWITHSGLTQFAAWKRSLLMNTFSSIQWNTWFLSHHGSVLNRWIEWLWLGGGIAPSYMKRHGVCKGSCTLCKRQRLCEKCK